ncbi:MAG TPA: VWA domain-containing protein, partial [Actinomycetota bacterium]
FATEPEIVVAPTLERVRVVGSLAALAQGEGTVIGDGLTSGLDTLEEEWRRDGEGPAAVVLLSDGRDTGSEEAPDLAAARAQSLGVPVHTVVLGQFGEGEGGADEELMERIAETTGGSPYTAATADELDGVYDTIRTQISTELGVSDFGAVFVALAGVMAIGATVILLMLVRE